jgi:hypothetical protein
LGPFDRFNDRAKRVLALAQDEAIRFNLLLAISATHDVGATVLVRWAQRLSAFAKFSTG